jgi:hypothetical protein
MDYVGGGRRVECTLRPLILQHTSETAMAASQGFHVAPCSFACHTWMRVWDLAALETLWTLSPMATSLVPVLGAVKSTAHSTMPYNRAMHVHMHGHFVLTMSLINKSVDGFKLYCWLCSRTLPNTHACLL